MHTQSSPRLRGMTASSTLPVTRGLQLASSYAINGQYPRNMTGIYLGLEGNIKPPKSKHMIPPLAKKRGLSHSAKTPMERRRHEMVELLRIKEETRGFVGNPVKQRKKPLELEEKIQQAPPDSPRSPRHLKKWGPGKLLDINDFESLIRTNPRKFTPVNNSGVTRSENLTGWMSYGEVDRDSGGLHLTPGLLDEVHRVVATDEEMPGLEGCYKKIMQGNVQLLQSFLPGPGSSQRPGPRDTSSRYTGFSVRSYRNPSQAEIVADFPDPRGTTGGSRPRTVPAHRLAAPSPYFFRHFHGPPPPAPAKSAASVSALSRKTAPPSLEDTLTRQKVVAGRSSGGLSLALQRSSSLAIPEAPQPSPQTREGVAKDEEPAAATEAGDCRRIEISMHMSAEAAVDDTESKSDSKFTEGGAMEKPVSVEDEALGGTGEGLDCGRDLRVPGMKTSSSGADITLVMENEDGTSDEVEIDHTEEEPPLVSPQGRVRKASIAEKVSRSKASEAIAAIVKESAEQRQKDFEKLLNEHAELVQEISRTASQENLGERDH